MQAINLEANFEKTKEEIPILGKTGKGNKTGLEKALFLYCQFICQKQGFTRFEI